MDSPDTTANRTFKTGIRLENNVEVNYSLSSHFLVALVLCFLSEHYGWALSLFMAGIAYVYLAKTGRWVLEIDGENGSVTRYFQSIFRLEHETVSANEFDVVAMRCKLRVSSQKGRSHSYFHVIYLAKEDAAEGQEFECQPLVNHRQCRETAIQIASCLNKDFVDYTTVQTDRLRADEVDKPLVHLLQGRQELNLPPTPDFMRSLVEHSNGRTTIIIPPLGFDWKHAATQMTPAWFLGGLLLLGTILNAIQGEVDGLGSILVFVVGIFVISLCFFWYPTAYKKEQVEIKDGRLTIRSTLLDDSLTQFDTEEITNIVGRIGDRTPSLPGVTVMARDSEATFGSELTDEEQRYLCGVVRAAIVLNNPPNQTPVAELVESPLSP